MTSITIKTKELHTILSRANAIINSNSQNEVHTLIKAVVFDNKMMINCIGSSLFLESSISCEILENKDKLEFLFKTDLILELLPLIKDEIITIEVDNELGNLTLKATKTKQTIRLYNHYDSEFIVPKKDLVNDNNLSFWVRSQDFVQATKIVNVSVGLPKNITDPKFLNICFNFNTPGILSMVSTDRFRIGRVNVIINKDKNEDSEQTESKYASDALVIDETLKTYLFTPKNLGIVNSFLDGIESCFFKFTKDYMWVHIGDNTLAIQYAGNEFNDMSKVIPQSFTFYYTVNKEEFKNALKQAMVISKRIATNKAVHITIDGTGHKMLISSKNTDGANLETDLPIYNYNGDGEIIELGYNIDYLLDFINQIKDENITIEHINKNMVMSPEGKKDNILYLSSGLK